MSDPKSNHCLAESCPIFNQSFQNSYQFSTLSCIQMYKHTRNSRCSSLGGGGNYIAKVTLYLNQALGNVQLTLTKKMLDDNLVDLLSDLGTFKCFIHVDSIEVGCEILQHDAQKRLYWACTCYKMYQIVLQILLEISRDCHTVEGALWLQDAATHHFSQ